MRLHKGSLLVAGGLIVLLAGCNNGGSTATPASESASPTDSSSASADSGTDSGSTTTTVVVPTTVAQAPAPVNQAPDTTTVTEGPDGGGSANRHNGNGHQFGNANNSGANNNRANSNGANSNGANINGNRNGNGGLRAMNNNEKQMFQRCQRDTGQSGCNEYTSDSLRKRGIDPNS
jgi:hypothetical protein